MIILDASEEALQLSLMSTCLLVLLLLERRVFDKCTAVLTPVFWLDKLLALVISCYDDVEHTVDFQYSDIAKPFCDTRLQSVFFAPKRKCLRHRNTRASRSAKLTSYGQKAGFLSAVGRP